MRRGRRLGLRAAELAWCLLVLLSIARKVRDHGLCVGELWPRDVTVCGLGLERVPAVAQYRGAVNDLRRRWHLQRGHDSCCELLGIPRRAVLRLLAAWGAPGSVSFVAGLFVEIEQASVQMGAHESLAEIAEYVVRKRITPRAPEDPAHAA